MKKRLLSMLLAACMVIPSLQVSAAEVSTPQEPQKAEVFDEVYEYDAEQDCMVLVDTDVINEEVVGADLPQIDAPTNAKWILPMGNMGYYGSENGTNEYGWTLYKVGVETPITSGSVKYGASYTGKERSFSLNPYALSLMDTGSYYFTVYAIGNEEWADSEVCKSDVFDYVKPDKNVGVPTNLRWEDTKATWDMPDDAAMYINLQYREVGSETWEYAYSVIYQRADSMVFKQHDFSKQMNKDGYYRFKVQALSNNILEAGDSEWSDWSPEISTNTFSSAVINELQDMLNNNTSADTIKDTLEKKDSSNLAAAIQTDAAVRENLEKAEAKYAQEKGISVGSEVSSDMADKIKGDINILGAAFNAGESVSKMSLKVTKPTIEKEYDKQSLKNVVQINMTLDGAGNTDKLAVPVRISMPIPAGMSAEKLQILHYHNNGTYETLWTYIENGMVYFTLTSFSTFVFGNVVDDSGTVKEPVGELPFTDVQNNWMYEGIKYVYDSQIMKGVGDGTLFAPNDSLTRAMFATVLYRMAGEPAVTSANTFSDVPDGKWFSNAIIWANEKGIVSGYGKGIFGLNDNITREQMAKMMMEYAKVQGYDTSEKADLGTYPDKAEVSGWASEYMSWAVGSGMIGGKNVDGKLSLVPKGDATRAECATVLMRFSKKYK